MSIILSVWGPIIVPQVSINKKHHKTDNISSLHIDTEDGILTFFYNVLIILMTFIYVNASHYDKADDAAIATLNHYRTKPPVSPPILLIKAKINNDKSFCSDDTSWRGIRCKGVSIKGSGKTRCLLYIRHLSRRVKNYATPCVRCAYAGMPALTRVARRAPHQGR